MSPALPLTLKRLADTGVSTFGQLIDAEENEICKILELGWHDNAPNKSCIPPGTYKLIRAMHHASQPGGYEVFEVANVPGRQYIQIHIGNYDSQTQGCLLTGTAFDDFGMADGDVTGSAAAFQRFMFLMRDVEETTLTVVAPQEAANAA